MRVDRQMHLMKMESWRAPTSCILHISLFWCGLRSHLQHWTNKSGQIYLLIVLHFPVFSPSNDLVIRKWTAAAHLLKTIALLILMTPFYTDICKCVRIINSLSDATNKASENVLQLDLQSKGRSDNDMFVFTYHIPDMSLWFFVCCMFAFLLTSTACQKEILAEELSVMPHCSFSIDQSKWFALLLSLLSRILVYQHSIWNLMSVEIDIMDLYQFILITDIWQRLYLKLMHNNWCQWSF